MGVMQSILGLYPRKVRLDLSDPSSRVSIVVSGRLEVASDFAVALDAEAAVDEPAEDWDPHLVWPQDLTQSDAEGGGAVICQNPLVSREPRLEPSVLRCEAPSLAIESETTAPMELLDGEPLTEILWGPPVFDSRRERRFEPRDRALSAREGQRQRVLRRATAQKS